MQEFFYNYKILFTIIHLFGFAIGLGGATIADTLFFRFLKDLKITKKEKDTLSIVSGMIFAGLFVLYLSGTALVLSDPEDYLNSSKFLTKLFIVIVITINGVILHKVISPKLMHIHWHVGQEANQRHYKKLAFACGAISVVSWYTAFILGAIHSIPINTELAILIYLAVIILSVLFSQLLEYLLCKYLD
jgi:uncharacterized membrane protein YbjE (DUF340 family)